MGSLFSETGKLDNQEIRKQILELTKKLKIQVNPKLIDTVIDEFWFHDFYNHFIGDKEYFKTLLKYLEKSEFKEFNRFDYYSFLFNKTIKKSEQESFYKLALFFEKRQTDRLELKNFDKKIKELGLTIKTYGVEVLKKKHLIKIEKVEEVEYCIWEHHSLTEFLVAKWLLEKENLIDEFVKLAILEQEGITAFKGSWVGVLRFLLESNKQKETIEWLLDFLEKFPDNFDDNLGELITFVIDKQNIQINSRIFKLIYEYYFKQLTWLPVWTRSNLSKFISAENYQRLKKDIKQWPKKTETFVKRGNVVAIIGGMLEGKHSLINKKEKDYWKKTLIKFAIKPNDDGNGVLQRHCFKALEYYKDENIIKQLEPLNLLGSTDSLLREAFIELCSSMPNSKVAINNLIEGLKNGSNIYARHGLYKITNQQAFVYFLKQISKDEVFLKEFLKHESIFDKAEGDQQILEKMEKWGKQNLVLLKKLFSSFLTAIERHEIDNSNFLQELAKIIGKLDKNFLFELIGKISKNKEDKTARDFYDLKNIFALLLTSNNLKNYIKEAKKFPKDVSRWAYDAIYIAKRVNGITGGLVYQKAIKLKVIKEVDHTSNQWEERDKKIEQDRLDQFVNFLEPAPGKYIIQVFKNYLQNTKEFDEFFKTKKGKLAKRRLIYLVKNEVLEKADPRKFKVKLAEPKNSGRFTWSQIASYYGDVLEVANIFNLNVSKYRQKIINFIPYCFSPSQVLNLVKEISDKEFSWVNKVFINPDDDRRYLTPSTYLYLIKQYADRDTKLKSVKKVLLSMIDDLDMEERNRMGAIESLTTLIDKKDIKTKEYLKKIKSKFNKPEFIKVIDDLLIQVFHDDGSINNRFKLLKQEIKFNRPVGGHSVGKDEMELDYLANAKPLIELKNKKYLPKFFDLLDYSFKFSQKLKTSKDKKDFAEYINYLWKIVTIFVDELKNKGSFKPLLRLEKWIENHKGYENLNWLAKRVVELRKSYINEIGIID